MFDDDIKTLEELLEEMMKISKKTLSKAREQKLPEAIAEYVHDVYRAYTKYFDDKKAFELTVKTLEYSLPKFDYKQ